MELRTAQIGAIFMRRELKMERFFIDGIHHTMPIFERPHIDYTDQLPQFSGLSVECDTFTYYIQIVSRFVCDTPKHQYQSFTSSL